MEYRGTIRSGTVVLENGGAGLADGTQVRVTPIEAPPQLQTAPADPPADAPSGTLGERLMKFAGRFKGLPPDLARNHDSLDQS